LDTRPQGPQTGTVQIVVDLGDDPAPDGDIQGMTARGGVDESEKGGTTCSAAKPGDLATHPNRAGQGGGDGSVNPVEQFGDTESLIHQRITQRYRLRSSSSGRVPGRGPRVTSTLPRGPDPGRCGRLPTRPLRSWHRRRTRCTG